MRPRGGHPEPDTSNLGAVLLSFVVFGLFVGERRAARGYPRLNLLRFGPFRATLASPVFVSGLRAFSVALFALVILTGLTGNQRRRSSTSRRRWCGFQPQSTPGRGPS